MAPSSTFPAIHVHSLNGLPPQSQGYKGQMGFYTSHGILEVEDRYRKKEKEVVQFPLPGKGQISKKNSVRVPNVGPQERLCE